MVASLAGAGVWSKKGAEKTFLPTAIFRISEIA